jgi:hypothetical protein
VQDGVILRALGEAVLARRDQKARRETLDVPLPRPLERLVEVVDVEHEAPLGRRKDAEVGEMRVATALDRQAGARGRGEVARHDERGSAKERERRGEHAPVADRHELRDARGGLALEQLDRVRAIGRGLEDSVARPRRLRASGPSARDPFLARRALRRASGSHTRRSRHDPTRPRSLSRVVRE